MHITPLFGSETDQFLALGKDIEKTQTHHKQNP